MPDQPAFFESQPIRRIHNQDTDTWWFSVVDIIKILTQQPDTRKAGLYWRVLKSRLSKEGSQTVTECNGLKLPAEDGKSRVTDCATAESMLRLVQSVPSPKAEPIKLWLAKVGYERMQELADPSLSIDRAREVYKKQGRSEKWIAQRMTGQETRNKLTDYWSANEVKPGQEFALNLTNATNMARFPAMWLAFVRPTCTFENTRFSACLFRLQDDTSIINCNQDRHRSLVYRGIALHQSKPVPSH